LRSSHPLLKPNVECVTAWIFGNKQFHEQFMNGASNDASHRDFNVVERRGMVKDVQSFFQTVSSAEAQVAATCIKAPDILPRRSSAFPAIP
jgi:hypothetical protein